MPPLSFLLCLLPAASCLSSPFPHPLHFPLPCHFIPLQPQVPPHLLSPLLHVSPLLTCPSTPPYLGSGTSSLHPCCSLGALNKVPCTSQQHRASGEVCVWGEIAQGEGGRSARGRQGSVGAEGCGGGVVGCVEVAGGQQLWLWLQPRIGVGAGTGAGAVACFSLPYIGF